MSATQAAALKSFLETKTLGLPWFNRKAPLTTTAGEPQPMPYGVIVDQIGVIPERSGDGRYARAQELVQIDIYQTHVAFDPQLVPNTLRALSGAKLPTAPQHVYGVELVSMGPGLDPDLTVDRKTITVNLRRKL